MKHLVFPRAVVLALLALLPVLGFAATSSKPQLVTLLDGTKVIGVVENAGDYTIRVTSDSGIQNFEISELSERDFNKFGFFKDRSHDGKFWYERAQALAANHPTAADKATAASPMGGSVGGSSEETSPYSSLISEYEKTLSSGSSSNNTPSGTDSADGQASTPQSQDQPVKLFSGGGSTGSPFSSGFNSSVVQPAVSAAAAAATTATSVVPAP